MNKIFFLVSAVLLTSCEIDTSLVESVIDQCNNDPACTIVIDNAIDEELEERGITGGKMTLLELEQVEDFLLNYLPSNLPLSLNNTEILAMRFWLNFSNGQGIIHDGIVYDPSGILDYIISFQIDLFKSTYLNLKDINTENKQLITFVNEFNQNIKLVIFKTGLNSFNYEIWHNRIDTYKIDLEMQSLYFNDELVILNDDWPPYEVLSDNVINQFVNKFKDIDETLTFSVNQENVNMENHYRFEVLQKNKLYFYSEKEIVKDNYYAHRLYFFDLDYDSSYSFEFYEDKINNLTYLSVYEVYDQKEFLTDERYLITYGLLTIEDPEELTFLDLFQSILLGEGYISEFMVSESKFNSFHENFNEQFLIDFKIY